MSTSQAAMSVSVESIVWREDLYPRLYTDHATVQRYAQDLEVLPPIEVNQNNELIDGWHRWTAHRKNKAEIIDVLVTQTRSDAHLLELAIERNATHGLQLSRDDKRDMAHKIYSATPERERDKAKKHLAKILSVSERTVRGWLSDVDKRAKDARNDRIFNQWLACRTFDEISEREGCDKATVSRALEGCCTLADLPDRNKLDAEHKTHFDVPWSNLWWFDTPRSESRDPILEDIVIDNLLYLYTDPFDIIVDPFAGAGGMIDVCKTRFRRYWVSDRLPVVEREREIRKWDITDGVPPLP